MVRDGLLSVLAQLTRTPHSHVRIGAGILVTSRSFFLYALPPPFPRLFSSGTYPIHRDGRAFFLPRRPARKPSAARPSFGVPPSFSRACIAAQFTAAKQQGGVVTGPKSWWRMCHQVTCLRAAR